MWSRQQNYSSWMNQSRLRPYHDQKPYVNGKINESIFRTINGSWSNRKYHFERDAHETNDHKMLKKCWVKKRSVEVGNKSNEKSNVVKQIWIPESMIVQLKNLMGPKVIWVPKSSF